MFSLEPNLLNRNEIEGDFWDWYIIVFDHDQVRNLILWSSSLQIISIKTQFGRGASLFRYNFYSNKIGIKFQFKI